MVFTAPVPVGKKRITGKFSYLHIIIITKWPKVLTELKKNLKKDQCTHTVVDVHYRISTVVSARGEEDTGPRAGTPLQPELAPHQAAL